MGDQKQHLLSVGVDFVRRGEIAFFPAVVEKDLGRTFSASFSFEPGQGSAAWTRNAF